MGSSKYFLAIMNKKIHCHIYICDNEKENCRILTNKEIYASIKKPTTIETIRLNTLDNVGLGMY
jgi:hypothetical protein